MVGDISCGTEREAVDGDLVFAFGFKILGSENEVDSIRSPAMTLSLSEFGAEARENSAIEWVEDGEPDGASQSATGGGVLICSEEPSRSDDKIPSVSRSVANGYEPSLNTDERMETCLSYAGKVVKSPFPGERTNPANEQ